MTRARSAYIPYAPYIPYGPYTPYAPGGLPDTDTGSTSVRSDHRDA